MKKVAGTMGRWRKGLGGRTIRLINAMESNTMAEAAAPMIWERNNEYKKFKEKIKKKIKYCSGSYSMRKPSRIHTGRASRAAKRLIMATINYGIMSKCLCENFLRKP